MRITNKIMQNNSMYNINNNKITEDDYSTQMATGKKISRPSDDPVIAIRALRLRSTVTQLDQYYEKNAKDAESWLQVTEDALTTVTDVLTDAKKLANQGANKDLTIDDLNTIVTQLEELSNEYYSTGNVDFANRYIFTGYRTNTPLSYDGKTTANYVDINDEFNGKDIDSSKRVINLQDLSAETVLKERQKVDESGNPVVDGDGNPVMEKYCDTTEYDVQEVEVGRLRLSYDNLDYEHCISINLSCKDLGFDLDIPMQAGAVVADKGYTAVVSSSGVKGATHTATVTDPDGKVVANFHFDAVNQIFVADEENHTHSFTITGQLLDPTFLDKKSESYTVTSQGHNMDIRPGVADSAKLLFRENLPQSASSTISNTELQVVNMTFRDGDGFVHKAYIPAQQFKETWEDDGGTLKKTDESMSKTAYSVTVPDGSGYITYTANAIYVPKNNTLELAGYDVKAEVFDVAGKPVVDKNGNTAYEFRLTKDGVIDVDTDTESPLYGEIVLERWGDDPNDGVSASSRLYGQPKRYLNEKYVNEYVNITTDVANGTRKVEVKPGVSKEECMKDRVVMEGVTTVTSDNNESTASFSDTYDNGNVTIPLLKSQDQQYTINIIRDNDTDIAEDERRFSATVNSDGTFTITNKPQQENGTVKIEEDTGARQTTVIRMTENGSIYSSYTENELDIDRRYIISKTTPQGNSEDLSSRDEELGDDTYSVDKVYQILDHNKDKLKSEEDETFISKDLPGRTLFLNAVTGEVLMTQALKERLASLDSIINANTIDVVYDKREWSEGDIQPQHLFNCTYVGPDGRDAGRNIADSTAKNRDIVYNGGFRGHDIQYDVGYNQRLTINTTADQVFTTDVKRDVADLSKIMDQLNQVNTAMKTLKDKLAETVDSEEKTTIQKEIDAAKKAYDYLRTDLQKEFEHKISSMSAALDAANVAVTQNGTRSRRLELIQARLQNQTTTFKTLQSANEDADIAETATNLTTAQTTYQASLIATGKISKTSLMDYI